MHSGNYYQYLLYSYSLFNLATTPDATVPPWRLKGEYISLRCHPAGGDGHLVTAYGEINSVTQVTMEPSPTLSRKTQSILDRSAAVSFAADEVAHVCR